MSFCQRDYHVVFFVLKIYIKNDYMTTLTRVSVCLMYQLLFVSVYDLSVYDLHYMPQCMLMNVYGYCTEGTGGRSKEVLPHQRVWGDDRCHAVDSHREHDSPGRHQTGG